jgi:hypothetical protein
VSQDNLEAAKSAFKDLGFEVTTGQRYLGGFLGEEDALKAWIQGKTHNWAEAVKELASAANKNYPQTAYSGLQRSLQHEWQFVQRVIPDIGDQFAEMGKAISHTFLPALFGEDIVDDDPRLKRACLPVKHAVWRSQTQQHLPNGIMKQAYWYALIFRPPFGMSQNFERQIIRPSSMVSRQSSNVATRRYMTLN